VNSPSIFVGVAEAAVAAGEEVLVTVGLGSCVAILLYDADVRVAGMAHVLLPAPHRAFEESQAAKYATSAVPHLLREMSARGADRRRVTARIVGGASMFSGPRSSPLASAGARNLEATRDALEWAGVPVTGEEVGSDHGRSVRLFAADGRVVVSSYRRGDVIL